MIATDLGIKSYTIEQYLAFEETAKGKHQYINGKIVAKPSKTFVEAVMMSNILTALMNAVEGKKDAFWVLNSDMRTRIDAENNFVYPDGLVIHGKPKFYKDRKDTITNPLLIVEVLSKSTQKYDEGGKFTKYRTLSSFKEYVLVSQSPPCVVAHFRKDTDLWRITDNRDITGSIYLESINCTLALADIYNGVADLEKNEEE